MEKVMGNIEWAEGHKDFPEEYSLYRLGYLCPIWLVALKGTKQVIGVASSGSNEVTQKAAERFLGMGAAAAVEIAEREAGSGTSQIIDMFQDESPESVASAF